MATAIENATSRSPATDVSPQLLAQWLEAGDTVAIDVREDFEHNAEHISDTPHHPLGKLDPETIRRAHAGKRVVFYCRTGRRSKEAAGKYRQGDGPTFHLAGGIEGWKAAGQAVVKPAGAPKIPIMRQVQVAAGSLVALGVLLGAFVSPWFLILAGFVGTGLMYAGLTGWCGMALLLSGMPWNCRANAKGANSSCAIT